MSLTEPVRKDHRILRAKLRLLEAAMRVAPEAQFVLREMCWSLAQMLDDHIKHEIEVLQPYRNRIQALTQEHMAQEHADQQVVLRDVNALLLRGLHTPMSKVVPPLAHLIEELREHMDQEEREVFPIVDQIAAEELRRPPTQADPLPITETIPPSVCRPEGPATSDRDVASPTANRQVVGTMTVNHILHIHPKARGIFLAFKVDGEGDGLHCLDELYWRRGIDVAALLRQLNQSVTEKGGSS